MTAAVLAARPGAYKTEDEAITRAQAVLDQAGTGTWTWGAIAIAKAARDVREAIETHHALRAGVLGWETYDSDLREYADPDDVAVTKSAEDAEELAGYLAEVIGKHSKGEQQ